ncbi:MAG: TFIIB-type zinc ribbon-containing protein [Nakamurella sp.]
MTSTDDGFQPPPTQPQAWPPPVPPQAWPPPGQQQPAPPPAPQQAWPPPGQQQPAPPPVQQPGQQQAPPPGVSVVRTDAESKDGLTKCGRCGATEISLNIETGNLRCGFCRFEMQSPNALQTYGLDGDVSMLTGIVVGSGSDNIVPSTDLVLTFKCSACGADVVIDSANSTQARCHWCRNTLSMNEQIPNGAVPDMILPFKLPKDVAVAKIKEFVGKRMAFAHPTFKAEFNAENVMGVYLPYMVFDANAHVALAGQGEHQTRSYTVKRGDDDVRLYDADVYDVRRDFSLYIDDLTVESSSERRDQNVMRNSNNIINAIMPFDVENSVCYDSNYLTGFTSERRDTNLDDLTGVAAAQSKDIARYRANEMVTFYDRGVRWDDEQLHLVGQRWVSAYLPVWLYSYYETKSSGKSFVHYVAVNGRTGETMGSVPINQRKLLLVAAGVELLGIIAFLLFFFLVGG